MQTWKAEALFSTPVIFVALFATASGWQEASGQASQEVQFPPLAALGPPMIPADNKQSVDENGYPTTDDPKVELGSLLFFDNRLSGDASISCADCHDPEFGWTDGADVCRGYAGTVHWRNCQSVVDAAYYAKLFWAGSSKSLEAQAEGAARGGVGGNGERDMMEERLRQVPEYVRMFRLVFGTEWPNLQDAWRAIAAFERTLIQTDTPFDLYMRGDESALSEEAKSGLELFQGKAGCIQCHNGPFLTDEKYYNLGLPENPVFEEDPLRQITFRFEQYAKGVSEEIYRTAKTDLGLYYRMKRHEDMGKFRTPTLRYLVYTSPYMHNGVFFTLEEVVEFYDQGGGDDPIEANFGFSTKTERMIPLGLSDDEKAALVALLESFSGEEITIERSPLPRYAVMR